MTSDYDDADDSELEFGLSENGVRNFQAALAIQMSLLTGRRIGQARALEATLRTKLGHGRAGLTERYLRSSKRVEGQATEDAVDLTELCAFYTAVDIPWTVGGARDRATPPSPYSRVHQDLSRVDALSAHLTALRAELGDKI